MTEQTKADVAAQPLINEIEREAIEFAQSLVNGPDKGKSDSFNFFPDHIYSELMLGLCLMVLLSALATILPATMGPRANPLATPEIIKPEWFFYVAFRWLKLFSGTAAVLSMGLCWASEGQGIEAGVCEDGTRPPRWRQARVIYRRGMPRASLTMKDQPALICLALRLISSIFLRISSR